MFLHTETLTAGPEWSQSTRRGKGGAQGKRVRAVAKEERSGETVGHWVGVCDCPLALELILLAGHPRADLSA